jgi:ribosomal protein L11 methyltransferase
MDSYYRIRLIKVPSTLEEEITLHCFAHSCLGISEALNYVQKDLVYDPTVRPQKFKDMDAYFSERPTRLFFDGLSEIHSAIKWEVLEEAQKDWLEEWKKGFKPFQLVGPYWVIPSWEEMPQEAGVPLHIDPGMAFGTGTHATTQLAAAFIYRWFQKPPLEGPISVLDVGTGTAILAILARLAGAKNVMGIDVDPEACRVARENLARNPEANQVQISDQLIEEVHETFHLVVANIIDGILLNIKKDLLRVLKPDGHIIVTGVLEERESQFIDEFIKDTNLKIQRRLVKDEWVGYWMVNAP